MTRPNRYENVPGLGNVAVSNHALSQMDRFGISVERFETALLKPIQPDLPEGYDIVWRERSGLRIVILINPEPDLGWKLVKTVYRIIKQAKIK